MNKCKVLQFKKDFWDEGALDIDVNEAIDRLNSLRGDGNDTTITAAIQELKNICIEQAREQAKGWDTLLKSMQD